MVMQAEPLQRCLDAICAEHTDTAPVVLFSPIGQTLQHHVAAHWSQTQGAVLLCGRYEGIDQRFIDRYVTHQISLGDFVLSGGEIAAVAFLDSVTRLLPGVLQDQASHIEDSFNPALDGLLDCPHYTRPVEWDGVPVPPVLMSGNHAAIADWRREQSLQTTWRNRPDLLERAQQQGTLTAKDLAFLAKIQQKTS